MTFREDLNRRSNQIMGFVSLISFAWLPYIPTDMALHPDRPLIVLLRLGLPFLGIAVFLLRRFARFKDQGLFFLVIFGGYLEIATGLITGLTGGHAVYIGGYLFILTLLAAVPIPRRVAWIILGLSLASFVSTGLANGMSFVSREELYSLNDLVSTSVVAAAMIFVLDRIRRKSWEKSEIIEQQNRELEADRARIDSLLLNILPAPVAAELKETGSVKPVFYTEATVVFTDFVGFTRIAEKMPPEELVTTLDSAFSGFDEIMDTYGLEKLKTIGDAYMFAGGLPSPGSAHAVDCLLASLDIVRFVREKMPGWEIRIGVNTGSMMAGVVGDKKFVYDIWGDAVNIASRLETGGSAGQINIAETTRREIEPFFEVEPRGKIHTKNRGELDMFFASRLKREYAADEEGLVPNAVFWKEYKNALARES